MGTDAIAPVGRERIFHVIGRTTRRQNAKVHIVMLGHSRVLDPSKVCSKHPYLKS